MRKYLNLRANIALGLIFAFLANTLGPMPVYAQDFRLPAPGVRVSLSPEFNPPILKGIKVHPDNPFRFDFILDQGDSPSLVKEGVRGSLKQEATKLIKYFLASLTIPEKDLWVNLSPYEKDRIVPKSFGQTEMGRDLLAEDYMLKQITASLIYPEGETGKKFWKRIYEEAAKKFGTTNIPVNTFNKVWIVPEKAVVYENAKAGTAYVVESKLKVMLEQDYLAISHNVIPTSSSVIPAPSTNGRSPEGQAGIQDTSALGSQIIRQIVIPELTKEINEGKNFAQLRQVYNSLILATWYKKKIKDSILSQVYADKNKTVGVQYTSTVIPAPSTEGRSPEGQAGIQNKNDVEAIYQRYLQAFKKGAYNYIKEEIDPATQQTIPRKHFSGGISWDATKLDPVLDYTDRLDDSAMVGAKNDVLVEARLGNVIKTNFAMSSQQTSMLVPTRVAYDRKRNLSKLTYRPNRVRALLVKTQELLGGKEFENKDQVIKALLGEAQEQTAQTIIELASLLRMNFDYESSMWDLRPPLQYALEEGIFYKLADNLYITPITESFRRHLIFKTDGKGKVIFAFELMIPGEWKAKRSMEAKKRQRIMEEVERSFPEEEYSVKGLFETEIQYKGKPLYNFIWKKPTVEVLVYDYLFDGKRMSHLTEEVKKILAKKIGMDLYDFKLKIYEEAIEAYWTLRFLGYYGAGDMHPENMRLDYIYDEKGNLFDFKVQWIGDFEDLWRNVLEASNIERSILVLRGVFLTLFAVGMYQHENVRQVLSALFLGGFSEVLSVRRGMFYRSRWGRDLAGLLWNSGLPWLDLKDLYFKTRKTVAAKMVRNEAVKDQTTGLDSAMAAVPRGTKLDAAMNAAVGPGVYMWQMRNIKPWKEILAQRQELKELATRESLTLDQLAVRSGRNRIEVRIDVMNNWNIRSLIIDGPDIRNREQVQYDREVLQYLLDRRELTVRQLARLTGRRVRDVGWDLDGWDVLRGHRNLIGGREKANSDEVIRNTAYLNALLQGGSLSDEDSRLIKKHWDKLVSRKLMEETLTLWQQIKQYKDKDQHDLFSSSEIMNMFMMWKVSPRKYGSVIKLFAELLALQTGVGQMILKRQDIRKIVMDYARFNEGGQIFSILPIFKRTKTDLKQAVQWALNVDMYKMNLLEWAQTDYKDLSVDSRSLMRSLFADSEFDTNDLEDLARIIFEEKEFAFFKIKLEEKNKKLLDLWQAVEHKELNDENDLVELSLSPELDLRKKLRLKLSQSGNLRSSLNSPAVRIWQMRNIKPWKEMLVQKKELERLLHNNWISIPDLAARAGRNLIEVRNDVKIWGLRGIKTYEDGRTKQQIQDDKEILKYLLDGRQFTALQLVRLMGRSTIEIWRDLYGDPTLIHHKNLVNDYKKSTRKDVSENSEYLNELLRSGSLSDEDSRLVNKYKPGLVSKRLMRELLVYWQKIKQYKDIDQKNLFSSEESLDLLFKTAARNYSFVDKLIEDLLRLQTNGDRVVLSRKHIRGIVGNHGKFDEELFVSILPLFERKKVDIRKAIQWASYAGKYYKMELIKWAQMDYKDLSEYSRALMYSLFENSDFDTEDLQYLVQHVLEEKESEFFNSQLDEKNKRLLSLWQTVEHRELNEGDDLLIKELLSSPSLDLRRKLTLKISRYVLTQNTALINKQAKYSENLLDIINDWVGKYHWIRYNNIAGRGSLKGLVSTVKYRMWFIRVYEYWFTMPKEIREVLQYRKRILKRYGESDVDRMLKERFKPFQVAQALNYGTGPRSLDAPLKDDDEGFALYNILTAEEPDEDTLLERIAETKSSFSVDIEVLGKKVKVRAGTVAYALKMYWELHGDEINDLPKIIKAIGEGRCKVYIDDKEVDLTEVLDQSLENVKKIAIKDATMMGMNDADLVNALKEILALIEHAPDPSEENSYYMQAPLNERLYRVYNNYPHAFYRSEVIYGAKKGEFLLRIFPKQVPAFITNLKRLINDQKDRENDIEKPVPSQDSKQGYMPGYHDVAAMPKEVEDFVRHWPSTMPIMSQHILLSMLEGTSTKSEPTEDVRRAFEFLKPILDESGNFKGIIFEQIKHDMRHDQVKDTAMNASPGGGIDLTSDKALSVQNNGQGIKFHIDPAQLEQLQNAPGFVPVIINIQPMNNLREFLGLHDAPTT